MTALKVTSIEEALVASGVTETTLTPEEKHMLDEEGYVIFHDFITPELLQKMRDRFEEIVEQERHTSAFVFDSGEHGVRRLSDLVNKGEVWDICWTHPKILAVAYHVLKRDFKLNSINARDALPGEGHQALHADTFPRVREDEPYHGVNTLWLLDDFLPDNGATRLVPGTHRLLGKVSDYMEDPSAPHPDELIPVLKAGCVIAYNFNLWHGGTQNRTQLMRRVLHPSFVAREYKQQYGQREFLKKSTYDRLSPAARYILDVD